MNRLLQRYANNVIVDQILYWSANRREITRVIPMPTHPEGSNVSIIFLDGSVEVFYIPAGAFQKTWDEARIVLETATNICGYFRPLTTAELDTIEPARRLLEEEEANLLRQRVERDLGQSIREVDEIFKEQLYEMFLDETGVQIKDPSRILIAKIEYALKQQAEQGGGGNSATLRASP